MRTDMGKRVLVIYGHVIADSFCHALGDGYAAGAREAGHEVRELRPAELVFDPILHKGYRVAQALEPDLLRAQEDLRWAQGVAWVFPVWWGMPPALMKGFIDRVFHPGFAFRYETRASRFQTPLLRGRSARVIATMDSPAWYYRWFIGAPGVRMMKNSLLNFCGFRPVRVSCVGSVRFSDAGRRARWLADVRALGRRAE